MAAKKGGRSKRNHQRRNKNKKQQQQPHQPVVEEEVHPANVANNNQENEEHYFSPKGIEIVQKLIDESSSDDDLQKEMEQLVQLVITSGPQFKKLDPKKLRKLAPTISQHLSKQTLAADHLGTYIGQQYLMMELNCSATTEAGAETASNNNNNNNKLMTDMIALKLAKSIVVGQVDSSSAEEHHQGDRLAEIIQSIQSELSTALMEYMELMCYSSIEETLLLANTGGVAFCGTLIDLVCNKYAEQLDELVMFGEKGAFLRQCPLYNNMNSNNKDRDELQRILKDLITDSQEDVLMATSKAKTIQHMISFAALAIVQDIDRVHKDCWECGKVCKSTLSACSCCKTANYCSAACQRKAWNSGHKFKCKALEQNYTLHQDSLNVMEATHNNAGGGENNNEFSSQQLLTILDEKVDYRIFSHVFTTSAAAFRKGTMKGPSMKYFYQNMERIVVDNWWMISIDLSAEEYQQAQIVWGTEALDEELNFWKLCHVLCFDLMGFYLPKMQMEQLGGGHPQLQGLTDGQLVALAVTSDLGFHKRHPKETGLPMPAGRFLQLYQSFGRRSDCGNKLWTTAKRQLQKQVLKDFRTIHHK